MSGIYCRVIQVLLLNQPALPVIITVAVFPFISDFDGRSCGYFFPDISEYPRLKISDMNFYTPPIYFDVRKHVFSLAVFLMT